MSDITRNREACWDILTEYTKSEALVHSRRVWIGSPVATGLKLAGQDPRIHREGV